jgi:hypothetical protein
MMTMMMIIIEHVAIGVDPKLLNIAWWVWVDDQPYDDITNNVMGSIPSPSRGKTKYCT